MKRSKILIFKTWNVKFFNLLKISFVLREKEFYHHKSIGLWWKSSIGLGIHSMTTPKVLKYFMIGLNLINLNCWLDFKYVGNCDKEQPLVLADKNVEFEIESSL